MGTIPDDALSYKKICEISNEELNIFLARKYFHPIPTEVSSADEMLSAGETSGGDHKQLQLSHGTLRYGRCTDQSAKERKSKKR